AHDAGLPTLRLDHHRGLVEALHHIGEEPRGDQGHSFLLHLHGKAEPCGHLKVRGGQHELAPRGVHQHARERRDAGPGGDRPLNRLEGFGEHVAVAFHLHGKPPRLSAVIDVFQTSSSSGGRPLWTSGTPAAYRVDTTSRTCASSREGPAARVAGEDPILSVRPPYPPPIPTVMPQARPLARIRLVRSCTWRYVLPLAGIRLSIFLIPWRAVVWSRPKCSPILISERPVSSRSRYMATWRAVVSGRD